MLDWVIALLIWLSADPAAVDHAAPLAAAAVDCAYASMVREIKSVPAPPANPGKSGGKPVRDCPTGTCPLVPR